jgi:hypothetical protein
MGETAEKILKEYHSPKISKKVEAVFRDSLINDLRRFYGEWVNVYDMDLKKGKFHSNFEAVFKTEHGRLYGNTPGSIQDHVFYTSHCFEQYKERGDCYKLFPLLLLAYKRVRNTTPTPADMLRFTTLNADQFCHTEKFIYVNVRNGVLVFEKLSNGILIAKTFLLPDMEFPKYGWVESWGLGLNLDSTDKAVEVCKELKQFSIQKPFFANCDLDYDAYVKTMQEQVRSMGLDI